MCRCNNLNMFTVHSTNTVGKIPSVIKSFTNNDPFLFFCRHLKTNNITNYSFFLQNTSTDVIEENSQSTIGDEINDTETDVDVHHQENIINESIALPVRKKEFVSPLPRKIRKFDDSNAGEALKCTKTLADTVSKRDEYTIYGEHIANKLRNSGRSKLEVASAQNAIDNICFKLLMGEFCNLRSTASSSAANSIIVLGSPQLSISSSPATSPSPHLFTVVESTGLSHQTTELQQSNGLLCTSSQQTANTSVVPDNYIAHGQQVYENEKIVHQTTDLEQFDREFDKAENLRMMYENCKTFIDR